MMNKKISEEEIYHFRKIPVQDKIDSMEAYLIGVNGHKYNMEQVGAWIFGGDRPSFTVSLIHRCYNFTGVNSGKYAPGCEFERKYGYRISREDIEAFVLTYPNGTHHLGIHFEDFLKDRINNARARAPKGEHIPSSKPLQFDVPNSNTNGYGEKTEYRGEGMLFFVGMGLLGALILLFLFLTGNLSRRWPISLTVLFFTIGGLSLPSLLKDDGSQGFDYKDYGRTSRLSGAAKAARMRRTGSIGFNTADRLAVLLRGKSLSSILNYVLVFVLIAKFFTNIVINQESISTRFWSLYIAIAVTKITIFDDKGLGLLGKLLFLGLVWLVAYIYI